MKYSEKISKQLNELVIKNYDAEKGYLNAISNVDSDRLKLFFKRRATERQEFAQALRKEILQYGEIPADSGRIKGVVHRNWMRLKALFSSNNEEAILEEAIRGEEASLEAYDEILEDRTLPASIDTLLYEHKHAIQAAINSEKVKEELVA